MTHNILIVGGTGSLGSALTEFYHDKGWNVTVFSRDGHKQQALGMKFPDVNFVLGDICDKDAMRFALEGQHYVVNAAAQKIVTQGEAFVDEFIRVNILGAQNVMQLCYDMGIFNLLQISSDKAVMPVNLYGATKMVCEKMAKSYGYSSLRYGNVIESRGSVYNIWKKQLSEGKKITVRIPYPTRFIMTIKDAVDLVDDALDHVHKGMVFVPKSLKAIRIDEMAHSLGADAVDWTEKPLLPGEKEHEILMTSIEAGYRISGLLASVSDNEPGNLDRSLFCSETAPRVTSEEFLEIVKNSQK